MMKTIPTSAIGDFVRALDALNVQDVAAWEAIARLFGFEAVGLVSKVGTESMGEHQISEKEPVIPYTRTETPTPIVDKKIESRPKDEDIHFLEPVRIEKRLKRDRNSPRLTIQCAHGFNQALYTRDGKNIITLSDLSVWDANLGIGNRFMDIGGHEGSWFAIGDDGKYVAIGYGGIVSFYDIEEARIKNTIYVLREEVWALTFRPDSETVIVVGVEGTMAMCNMNDERVHVVTDDPNIGLRSVASHRKGIKTIAGALDGKIWFIRADTGQLLKGYPAHDGAVETISFHPTGEIFASGATDTLVKIWESVLCEHRLTLEGHSGPVNSVAFHPNQDLISSGSDDKSVKIWNTQTGQCLHTLKPDDSEITSVCWNPEGTSLLASAMNGKVYVWDLQQLEGLQVTMPVQKASPIYQSLLEQQWERSVLKGLASTLQASGAIDAERVLESVAMNRPLKKLPRKTNFSMGRPVELLIDVDETMMPFTEDCHQLEKMMKMTTGTDLLRVIRFREDPDEGAGPGPVFDWNPWQLPAPGTHVIVVSNLGALPGRPSYTRRKWLKFAQQLADGNCSLCTLSPISPIYLSPDLRQAMKVVHWDRRTSLQHIKNLVLKR